MRNQVIVSKNRNKMIKKYLPFLLLFVLTLTSLTHAQDRILVYAAVVDGDTIPYFKMKEVTITGISAYLTPEEIRKNQKLIRNVKKVLPYAKMGRVRLDQIEAAAAKMAPKDRKAYIKKMEKDLLGEFTDELKGFTTSQGRVLLKLVDRETGLTSYELVDEMRGHLRAGFYQAFAKLWGYNLKKQFDPLHNKEDNLLERVVLSVEAGKI